MKEYPKINTIYKRDMTIHKGHNKSPLIMGEWSMPEFEYLKDNIWEWTEKIDGTNIRVGYNGTDVVFAGRTDNANIPVHLLAKLQQIFTPERLKSCFNKDETDQPEITLYGEGYGVKIQGGGNYIQNDVNFILFDIRIGLWWLQRPALEEIASRLNIPIVPVAGTGTLTEAADFVAQGFKSIIAVNREYPAEGVVLKPACGLLARSGERIITKIKTVDFLL